MDTLQIIWLALMVVFLIIEAATAGLASIWFAAGAFAALISSFLGGQLWLQITLFILVSVVTLVITRPLARKYVNSRVQATNADMVIGQSATVTERIDNVAGTGMATVGGRLWTARSSDGQVIEAGELTEVKAIEGVKLLVVPMHAHVIDSRA